MNVRADYDRVDWLKTDVQIARKLKVTKQAVQAARRVRGIAPTPHGGLRKGAGRKKSKKRAKKTGVPRMPNDQGEAQPPTQKL